MNTNMTLISDLGGSLLACASVESIGSFGVVAIASRYPSAAPTERVRTNQNLRIPPR